MERARRWFLLTAASLLSSLTAWGQPRRKTTVARLSISSNLDAALSVSTEGTKARPGARLATWWLWWGDGTETNGDGAPPTILSHVYPVGDYQLRLTVTDTAGGIAEAYLTASIRIRNSNAEPPDAALLASTDFTYLGMFKVPDTSPFANTYFSFSEGYLTGKRVGGTLTLLLTGPQYGANVGSPMYDLGELSVPADGALTTSLSTAPRATLIRSWQQGVVFTDTAIKLPNEAPHPDNNYGKITGIHYVGNDYGNGTQLVWTYTSAYGTPGEFPNIATSILNDNGTASAYGPWQHAEVHWELRCGSVGYVPQSVQTATGCGPLFVHAQVRGNAGGSPWGISCHPFTLPSISTPSDPVLNQASASITDMRRAGLHDQTNPAARNGFFSRCGSNASNEAFVYPLTLGAGSGTYQAGENLLIGGFPVAKVHSWDGGTKVLHIKEVTGSVSAGQTIVGQTSGASYVINSISYNSGFCPSGAWLIPAGQTGAPLTWGCGNSTTLDWLDSAVWIEGSLKKGFVGFGQMAETFSIASGHGSNYTYTGADPSVCHVSYGLNPCCHGQTNGPVEFATGPRAETIATKAFIWHPDHLIEVLNGTRGYHNLPVQEEILLANISSVLEQRTTLYQTSGSWFDPVAKRLYLVEAKREQINNDHLPVVHVFSVNC